MSALHRVYVNRKEGNEHVRVEDVEADSPAAAKNAVKVKRGETVGDVVVLNPGGGSASDDYVQAIAEELAASASLPMPTALKVARDASLRAGAGV